MKEDGSSCASLGFFDQFAVQVEEAYEQSYEESKGI